MTLRIQLFGTFSVWRDGSLIDHWDSDQTKSLLKILLTKRGTTFLKDQLIEYLWPLDEKLDHDQKLRSLHSRIHSLRRLLEPERRYDHAYILTRHEGYAFSAGAECTIDVEEFEAVLQQAEQLARDNEYPAAAPKYARAISLYRGEYLPENRYDDWATGEREKHHKAYVNALLRSAECLARQGDYRRAVDYCRQALATEKNREDIYRQLMIYSYLLGNPGEALRTYRDCEETLSECLGAKLSAQTQQLYEQILSGHVPEIDPVYPRPTLLPHAVHHTLGRLPFVGREKEYSHIVRCLEGASHGRGALILIGGEAGVGKTRLAQEAIQYAQVHLKASALIGRCTELGTRQSYQAPLLALRDFLSKLSPQSLTTLPALGTSVLAPWLPDLEQLVRTSKPLPALSPEQERLRFFEGTKLLFLHLAHSFTPLVVFLDDLHWADASTIDLLDYLSLRITEGALVIIGTYRTEAVCQGSGLNQLLQRAAREAIEGNSHSLQLATLPETAITEMLMQTAPTTRHHERHSRYLKRESGGNPFFLVALLQSLFETHAIRVDSTGHWILDEAHLMQAHIKALPQAVEGVIATRLERLRREDRQLLEILCVVGQEVKTNILLRLCQRLIPNRTQPELMKQLEHLGQAQLIILGDNTYHFAHEILREVVYQNLGAGDRTLWHGYLAEILEEFYRTEIPHGVLAYHYAQSGAYRKALAHLLPALQDAVNGYRNQEGLKLAEEAWDLAAQLLKENEKDMTIHSLQFEILREKIKIYDVLGRRQEQEATLVQLLNVASKLSDEKKYAEAHLMRAKLYLDTARHPLAQAECMEALKIAKTQKSLAMQASALHLIGIAHYRTSQYDQATYYLGRELELRNVLRDARNLAETFHYLALVSWRSGDYEGTTNYYREALRMFNQINDRQGRAFTLSAVGAMYWSQGDFQQAIKAYEEVRRLAAEMGDRRAEAEALSSLASTWLALGEYEKALEFREQAREIHHGIGEERQYGWDLNFVGLVYWFLGQHELALQFFGKTQEIAEEVGWDEGIAFALNNVGLVHWREGRYGKALRLSQEALEIQSRIGTKHEVAIVLRNLGEIWGDARQYAKSLESLDRALLLSQTLGLKFEEMQTLSDQSATYLKMRKVEKAVACANQSLQLLKQTSRSPHAPTLLFRHFQALHAARRREEALRSLHRAHKALMRRAKRIQKQEFRQSFLTNVPIHRQIVESHKRHYYTMDLSTIDCYDLLRKVRWKDGVLSPCCGSKHVRIHGQVNRTSEKRYLCMKCRKSFSDRVGTLFAHKNLPLPKLFHALVIISQSTDESGAVRAITKLGIHAYTAKNLCRKWRLALSTDELAQQLVRELKQLSQQRA
jgi:predicted ATPase/DNA-binding SARP family transcriptional activator/transposase-like protein